jgi:hypothetical protein
VVAAVPLEFVQDLEEDAEDEVAARAVVGLRVDVEQHHVRVAGDGPLDVAEEHRVLHLRAEELDGGPLLADVGVRAVTEEVREDFQEVGLAAAEEPRDPDAHLAGGVARLTLIDRLQIPADEAAQVLVEFAGDDELVQLLPDGVVVELVRLHDAVDGPEDVAVEQVFDLPWAVAFLLRGPA